MTRYCIPTTDLLSCSETRVVLLCVASNCCCFRIVSPTMADSKIENNSNSDNNVTQTSSHSADMTKQNNPARTRQTIHPGVQYNNRFVVGLEKSCCVVRRVELPLFSILRSDNGGLKNRKQPQFASDGTQWRVARLKNS